MSNSSCHVDCTVNSIPSPTLTSSILLNLSFRSSYQRIDLQTRQTLYTSSPNRSHHQFSFDPRLIDSPALLSQNLYGFLVCGPYLEPESRFNLAEEITYLISRKRPPLLEVEVCIRIVRSVFVNPVTPARVIVIDAANVGSEKKSQFAVKELIKKLSFECGDEREEDCSICFKNYRNHKKAVKTECDHVFHRNCIYKWLLKNNTCPLCRKRVY